MDPDWIPIVIIVMTIALTVGWIANSLIQARNRHQAGIVEGLDGKRQLELLSSENAGLKGQIGRLEERIAVLERIAVDPADRTAREIDSLR